MIFDFLDMLGTYESRKVGRDYFEFGDKLVTVSTCEVNDSDDPYETCFFLAEDPDDRDDCLTKIVETYGNKEAASEGHRRWCYWAEESEDFISIANYINSKEDQGTNFFSKLLRNFEEETDDL